MKKTNLLPIIQAIEKIVADEMCADIECKLHFGKFTTEWEKAMAEKLWEVYRLAHAYNSDNGCYDVHSDWRKIWKNNHSLTRQDRRNCQNGWTDYGSGWKKIRHHVQRLIQVVLYAGFGPDGARLRISLRRGIYRSRKGRGRFLKKKSPARGGADQSTCRFFPPIYRSNLSLPWSTCFSS